MSSPRPLPGSGGAESAGPTHQQHPACAPAASDVPPVVDRDERVLCWRSAPGPRTRLAGRHGHAVSPRRRAHLGAWLAAPAPPPIGRGHRRADGPAPGSADNPAPWWRGHRAGGGTRPDRSVRVMAHLRLVPAQRAWHPPGTPCIQSGADGGRARRGGALGSGHQLRQRDRLPDLE